MGGLSLTELAVRYFKQRGYRVLRGTDTRELPGGADLMIHRRNERRLVWVKDWRRTVGINVIINLDRTSENLGFPGPVIIAEKFSDHAKAYASRRGVKLITKFDMWRRLR